MINILLSIEELPPTLAPDQDFSWLARAAEESLLQAAAGLGADLSIVIADDARLQELNRQFLGIDAPTDVLSFPADETDPDTGLRYLGDIILSYTRAEAQARAGGHAVRDEMQLLVVHGVLHLLGHDHSDESAKTRMWELQSKILQTIGCAISDPAPDRGAKATRHTP